MGTDLLEKTYFTENTEVNKKRFHIKKPLFVVLCVLLLALAALLVYTHDYYHADNVAIECISNNSDDVSVSYDSHQDLVFTPKNTASTTGIIFYPGAKVEYSAYAPLMSKIASEGYTCVSIKMPLNLSIFRFNAAGSVINEFPEIENWYIAGHSLGGVSASDYLYFNQDKFRGMIFLASYTTKNFSKSNLNFLSIYGSSDTVLNIDKFNLAQALLPTSSECLVLEGCHSYFGNYGLQNGDTSPSVTADEQQQLTAQTIADWINNQ